MNPGQWQFRNLRALYEAFVIYAKSLSRNGQICHLNERQFAPKVPMRPPVSLGNTL